MVRERESKKDIQPQVQAKINIILDEYKDFPKKRRIDPTIIELNDYIYKEQQREQGEWETLVLYFEQESELRKYIKDSWEKSYFMNELFVFFQEVNKSDSERLQQRLILVCDILGEMLFDLESKGKSWFWKFRHILYKMEEYFLANSIGV